MITCDILLKNLDFVMSEVKEIKKENYSQEQIWDMVVNSFKNEFGDDVFRAWISNVRLFSINEFEVVLSVPTNFIRDWISREYFNGVFRKVNGERTCIKRGIKQILLDFFPHLMSFDIIIDKPVETIDNQDNSKANIISISENDNLFNIGLDLNENYTFENFIVGHSNRLAYQVCKDIAENNERSFGVNPLFLYGDVGLGKTHLCQSIAWTLKKNKPNHKIVYISAEKFMFMFIQSLNNQSINDFKNKFRNIDTLIIDDIQFIVGKDKTQKEFFYTFEALINEHKQIILACDKSPVYLENLDEKLKSRLNGGLIVDIKEADVQLRLDIVRKKSKELNLILTEEVEHFIAESISANCREIIGCLKRLKINQDIMNIKIKKDDVENILCDNLIHYRKSVSIENIQTKTAEYFGLTIEDLKSEKRIKELVLARHISMYLAKTIANKSFPDIAKKFNNRNHATVIHAFNSIKTKMENNSEIVNIINAITLELK